MRRLRILSRGDSQLPELKAARIAAGAGLLGAIVGAALSAIPVLIASRIQLDAEYLRPQRQAAYVQLIGDAEAFEGAERRLWEVVHDKKIYQYTVWVRGRSTDGAPCWSNGDITDFNGRLAERYAALEKLRNSSEVVQLLGSPEAERLASEIYNDNNNVVHRACQNQTVPQCQVLVVANPIADDRAEKGIVDFKEVARADLAS